MRDGMLLLFCLGAALAKSLFAQTGSCTFKPPFYLLHFGKGNVQDVNAASLDLYNKVEHPCPSDGQYAYISSTADCFHGDWHTLTEDHTPGDVGGNMLLVNSAYDEGVFLRTRVKGFKGGTTYRFGMWLMNVCKPSEKCPFPLLPNLGIRLQTAAGKRIAQFTTGELSRTVVPQWVQHRAQFTMPVAETELVLILSDNAPGGCGNDFALDDLTFSECIKTEPPKAEETKRAVPVAVKKAPLLVKKEPKKVPLPPQPVTKNSIVATVTKTEKEVPVNERPVLDRQPVSFASVPLALRQRTNPLVKEIETGPGEVLIELYDNGEIDGDTVSIYHNNILLASKQRLSQKPISLRIAVNKDQPHHELVMVANNLGSIPPNTSLMIVTAKDKQYRVFISSTEEQNAKVVIDLKQ